MPHFTHKFTWARLLTIAWIALITPAPVRAENDDIGNTLAQARLEYEEKLQAIRDEVLEKISTKQAALRAKSKPKLEEIAELDSARSAFTTAGQWPAFRNFGDCQTKLRKAAKGLADAYAKAETNYLKAGNDSAARRTRSQHEQFLTECDIASWSHNVVGHWKNEEQIIGSACKNVTVGVYAIRPYRMELIASVVGGDGSLTLDVPVPGYKRIEISTSPAAAGKIHIFLTIRESGVDADYSVLRPASAALRDDDIPKTLVLGCNHGTVRLESIRFKPILSAAGDLAFAAEPNSAPAAQIAAEDDVEMLWPKRSTWRGYMWHGQNPNDLKGTLVTDLTVTLDETGRVELHSSGWISCTQIWVLQLRGTQLKLGEIHSRCLEQFTEVRGEGTADGDTLQFRSSARVAGHSVNTIFYSKFELTRIVDE